MPCSHGDLLFGLEVTKVVRRKWPQHLRDEILASYQIILESELIKAFSALQSSHLYFEGNVV